MAEAKLAAVGHLQMKLLVVFFLQTICRLSHPWSTVRRSLALSRSAFSWGCGALNNEYLVVRVKVMVLIFVNTSDTVILLNIMVSTKIDWPDWDHHFHKCLSIDTSPTFLKSQYQLRQSAWHGADKIFKAILVKYSRKLCCNTWSRRFPPHNLWSSHKRRHVSPWLSRMAGHC